MYRICVLSIIVVTVFACTPAFCGYTPEKPKVQSFSSQGSLFATCHGDLLSVDIKDAALEEVLRKIADQTGVSFSLPPSLTKDSMMVRFANFEIDEGIDKILAAYDHIFIYNQPGEGGETSRRGELREVRIYLPEKGNKGESAQPVIIKGDMSAKKPSVSGTTEIEKADKPSSRNNVDRSVADWGKDLFEGDQAAKINAVQGLAKMGGAEAMGYLASALEDPNPEVSGEAERVLTDLYSGLEEDGEENASGGDPQKPIEGAPSFSIDSTGVMSEGPGGQIEVDIRLTDVPEKLIGGGLVISYDPSQLSIAGIDAYDGSALAGPWDKAMTRYVEKPENMPPGNCGLTVGNLSSVAPDQNGSINIARARFNKIGSGDPQITISTIPEYDGFVGDSTTVYDSKMPPTVFKLE